MNVIIIPGHKKPRTIQLNAWHLRGLAVVMLIILSVSVMGWFGFYKHYVRGGAGLVSGEFSQSERFLKDNLSNLSTRVGSMQAQLVQLDALGTQLGKMMGLKQDDMPRREVPQGGPMVPFSANTQGKLEIPEIQIDALARSLDRQSDYLAVLQHWYLQGQVRKSTLPSHMPIEGAEFTSGFGYREDPFTHANAMHEGVDFAAPVGTPIGSAAVGVVVYAQRHPEYGNMVEIDHGGGMTTRYAHMSAIKVHMGQFLRPGDVVGLVGATGRANGPHLHFEVRIDGVARNPLTFLQYGRSADMAKLAQ